MAPTNSSSTPASTGRPGGGVGGGGVGGSSVWANTITLFNKTAANNIFLYGALFMIPKL
ncbi:hypothetical protein [Flavobacterium suncheonense]|uniref:hypothetical protein n=1 Tax=Flavobacterium suncheonense TaxID=350894 RepID=UPI0003F52348|nr:hypothetical protein [Flavobacterium suncheonense]